MAISPPPEAKKVILLGGGQHCRVVVDVIEQAGGFEVVAISDLPNRRGTQVLDGYVVDLTDDEVALGGRGATHSFVSHGENLSLRRTLYELGRRKGFVFPTLVSPFAYVSPHAQLGAGTLAVHRALVNPKTIVGQNAILNSGSIVEHDCVIGDHCHVAPGAVLYGGVHVGAMTFMGAGAVVIEGMSIGENVIVRAGSVVRHDVPDNVVVAGNPAQWIRDRPALA